MKVLIVFRAEDTENLFVQTLFKGIRNLGVDIECSDTKFWNDNIFYDIIHFQWPEEVVGWNCYDFSIIDKLKDRIAYFKSQGSKFVYTRHNTAPHYTNNVIDEAYKIIEAESDIIVHMAQFSLTNFLEKYPSSKNIIIPHHIYENIYNENISKEEARRKLNINTKNAVITSFGKFRNTEESKMILKAFICLKLKNKFLLAPRIFPFQKSSKHSNIFKRIISWIGYNWIIPILKRFNIESGITSDTITNEELPFYMISSDIILIQRKHILNSGNIPLGFLFKKVVVGPDVGDVGEVLRMTGNPTFDPNDNKSIVRAIKDGVQLSLLNHGDANYIYAKKNLNIRRISQEYINCYENLLPNKNN